MANKIENRTNHDEYEVNMILDKQALMLMGLTQFAAKVQPKDHAALKVSVLQDKTILKLEPIE